MSIQEALDNETTLLVVKADDLKGWHNQVIDDTRRELEATLRKEQAEVYLTATDVCKILNIHRMTLQGWKNRGYLVPAMVGGRCLYKRSVIDQLLQKTKGK